MLAFQYISRVRATLLFPFILLDLYLRLIIYDCVR